MIAMTIRPGATTFIPREIAPPLWAPTTPAPAATTYNGHAFSIEYPTGWKIEDAENLNFAIAAEDYWHKSEAKKRRSRKDDASE